MTDFFIQAAKEAASAFETRTRPDGETFVRMTDDRPEWLLDAVYEAHDGWPDDWTFEVCAAAATDASHGNLEDDADGVTEWADAGTEVYTYKLMTWARDFADEVNEARSELGPFDTIEQEVMAAQCMVRERIGRIMTAAIQARADELEAAADDDDAPGFGALTL